jgi:hypothetical protein
MRVPPPTSLITVGLPNCCPATIGATIARVRTASVVPVRRIVLLFSCAVVLIGRAFEGVDLVLSRVAAITKTASNAMHTKTIRQCFGMSDPSIKGEGGSRSTKDSIRPTRQCYEKSIAVLPLSSKSNLSKIESLWVNIQIAKPVGRTMRNASVSWFTSTTVNRRPGLRNSTL